MKEKRLWLVVICALIVFSVAIALVKYNANHNLIVNENCSSESDCVKVQTTCCSCSMGGEEKCMTKSMAEYYKEKLAEECGASGTTLCPAVYNCEKDVLCKCTDGKCQK